MNDSQFYQLIDTLSQLTAYTIGRSVDNQLVLPQSKVSGHHARLIQCTSTSFIVEDLSSKNGSFVNDVRVTRKVVDKQDTLRFADTVLTVDEILALIKNEPVKSTVQSAPVATKKSPNADANPLDFTHAFADLQQVYQQYPILRKECRNREKMIRTGSVILSSIVGISSVLSTGGAALPLLHIMSGAGLSMLVPTLCSTLLSTEEKLEVIEKEYREKYRCPNPACRDPFGTREWELLVQQKSCRRCQAIWVN
ncbi:FHA domain-containing protein [Spirosoma radiotolerans]|uniref:Signal peptide protein n=1 Tax=Spirosoma radiotolerans TaxID=1379870 RepID=A0A0E3V8B1_9BACT|nr:FHA domain-containing protein [Spirosoma radiotolerans]AKD56151.1 signal peptide protein [Spirosoma radiotolerans]